MNDDNSLRLKALKGIVRTGKRLHIDVIDYREELYKSEKKHKRHYVKKIPKNLRSGRISKNTNKKSKTHNSSL